MYIQSFKVIFLQEGMYITEAYKERSLGHQLYEMDIWIQKYLQIVYQLFLENAIHSEQGIYNVSGIRTIHSEHLLLSPPSSSILSGFIFNISCCIQTIQRAKSQICMPSEYRNINLRMFLPADDFVLLDKNTNNLQ